MSAPIPKDLPLVRARDLEGPQSTSDLQLTGRLAHFRGIGTTTLATVLTARMQARRLPVIWISATADTVYPPDLAADGVDLDSLLFVFAADPVQAARAAEHLLRSGAFALLVIDLEDGADIPDAVQGRLLRLARAHEAGVLCISHGEEPLRGSMISLRGRVSRVPHTGNRYRVRVHISRDKQRGPGVRSGEDCYAPAGMH
jgi:recombination protein RecA